MRRPTRLAFAALLLALPSLPAAAKPPFVKKAQELGFKEITSCAACHTAKPEKGNLHQNERGLWLSAEKKKRNAKDVDVAWLKDFPAPVQAAK